MAQVRSGSHTYLRNESVIPAQHERSIKLRRDHTYQLLSTISAKRVQLVNAVVVF